MQMDNLLDVKSFKHDTVQSNVSLVGRKCDLKST